MSRSVTVVGSLHYDIMIEGARLPQRGETAVGRTWRPKCGGKGHNQAVACARAGAPTCMIGCVGADEFGRDLLASLDRHGIGREQVRALEGVPTGMSIAISESGGDYGAVIVSGANLQLTPQRIRQAEKLLADTAVLVLQNEVPDEANAAAAGIVRSAGGYVLLNAAPARRISPELVANVDLLVVNAVEAAQLTSMPVSQSDRREACRAAASRLAGNWPAVVVTAGADGLVFGDHAGNLTEIAAEPVKVQGTHGAGDCFVGTLAAMLRNGASVSTALREANHAAAILVSTPASNLQPHPRPHL